MALAQPRVAGANPGFVQVPLLGDFAPAMRNVEDPVTRTGRPVGGISYEHAALGTGPEVSDCDPVTLCDLLLQLELHIGKRAEVASDDLLPVAQPGDRLRHADEVDCVIRSQYLVGSIGVAARR